MPDTFPDLAFAYGMLWICLMTAYCFQMVRLWRMERRLQALERSSMRREGPA